MFNGWNGLLAVGARPAWIAAVSEVMTAGEAERAEAFGESLPAGLRLIGESRAS